MRFQPFQMHHKLFSFTFYILTILVYLQVRKYCFVRLKREAGNDELRRVRDVRENVPVSLADFLYPPKGHAIEDRLPLICLFDVLEEVLHLCGSR